MVPAQKLIVSSQVISGNGHLAVQVQDLWTFLSVGVLITYVLFFLFQADVNGSICR